MKRLVSTLNLSKEDWLRYRKCGITGTDAGAILDVNPYRSAFQIYHDKISDTIEDIDNEAMRQGRDLEDYVAQRFSEETGLKVRRANAIYQSEEHPLLLADFDRLIVGQKAGLECKTVSPFSADKWANLAMHRKLWPRCPVWRHCEINPRRKTKPLCRASSVLWMRWMAKCTRRCFWLNPFRWIRRRRFAVGTKICIAVFRLSAKVHGLIPRIRAQL